MIEKKHQDKVRTPIYKVSKKTIKHATTDPPTPWNEQQPHHWVSKYILLTKSFQEIQLLFEHLDFKAKTHVLTLNSEI